MIAFTMWVKTWDNRRVKINVPVGMTLGELEDQLHERCWTPTTLADPQKPIATRDDHA